MANEFALQRLAFANFAPTAAATYESGVIIPAGAVVKSLTSVEGTALATGTNVTFQVGTQDLTAAIATAAFTGVDVHALDAEVDGEVITADGELTITTTGTYTGDIDVYVEYYFTPNHT